MRENWTEADRIAALHGYDILDAETTAEFDDFVQIAAQICAAPISVVNLVDRTRQWFAAEVGLGVRETPLDVSICAHAILQPGLFVIPDLTQDRRFDCNPLVTGSPELRFYAGALLETADGYPLGTMCVLDYAPRPAGLNEQQAYALQALARQVMAQLELRRIAAEKDLLLLEAHHRVKNSLAMVQALLMMQARTTKVPEAAQQLRESAGRVAAVSTMHEHLYRAGASVQVSLAAYLESLVGDQAAALASTLDGRSIELRAAEVSWPSADAATVGLIVMEMVTNALKYGAGTITVSLERSGDEVSIAVEDEGRALPPDYDPSHSTGLGMRVLSGLLRSRRGRLWIDRTRSHTRFVAMLPVSA